MGVITHITKLKSGCHGKKGAGYLLAKHGGTANAVKLGGVCQLRAIALKKKQARKKRRSALLAAASKPRMLLKKSKPSAAAAPRKVAAAPTRRSSRIAARK